jgi:hypothetical protein
VGRGAGAPGAHQEDVGEVGEGRRRLCGDSIDAGSGGRSRRTRGGCLGTRSSRGGIQPCQGIFLELRRLAVRTGTRQQRRSSGGIAAVASAARERGREGEEEGEDREVRERERGRRQGVLSPRGVGKRQRASPWEIG